MGLGKAGFNAYDIAKLMGQAKISTSQRYVRKLPVGAGEAVMLKNQRRPNTVTSEDAAGLALMVKSKEIRLGGVAQVVRAWDS